MTTKHRAFSARATAKTWLLEHWMHPIIREMRRRVMVSGGVHGYAEIGRRILRNRDDVEGWHGTALISMLTRFKPAGPDDVISMAAAYVAASPEERAGELAAVVESLSIPEFFYLWYHALKVREEAGRLKRGRP